jgi:hypothetical protein
MHVLTTSSSVPAEKSLRLERGRNVPLVLVVVVLLLWRLLLQGLLLNV